MDWQELVHIFDQISIQSDVHDLLLQLGAFPHHLYSLLEVVLCLLVLFDQFSDLLILRTNYLLKFFLLFLYSLEFLLVVLFKVCEVAFGNYMKFLANLITIDIVFHLKPLRFSFHLFDPGFKCLDLVFEQSYFLLFEA